MSIESKFLDFESKLFYKSLFKIVGPIALQNFISALVGSVDVLMLSSVSQTAIAASSLAGQIVFILFMITIGLSSGLGMLASQYWGKKDNESIKTLMGIALRISSSVGFVFAIFAFFFPEFLMKIFTDEENVIKTGCDYLHFVSFSYFFMSITQVFQAAFKSVEKVKIVTALTLLALGLNVILNAVFIYGLCGIPKIGIVGVGIATSVSRAIELMVCLFYASRQSDIVFSMTDAFRKGGVLTKDFFKYSMPALGNELVWGAAFSVYSVILGHLGEDIVAANSVVGVVRNLASVLCFGMAYGGAILIGKTIGAGELNLAERHASRLARSTILAGLLGSIVMLALIPFMPHFAKLNEIASSYRTTLMVINSYSIFGAAVNTVFICGIFRAGGDSKFGFIVDSISMWCVSVPLGLLAAYVFKLSPLWVYFVLYLDEFEKMPIVIVHYFKKKWLRNITRDKLTQNQTLN